MKKNDNKDKSDIISFRIITIGDSGVGKTSIIKKYLYNLFDDRSLQTIGLNFSFKEISLKNGEQIHLKLIDTAGEERYKSMSKSYYKNCDAVLFVFDYNNIETFENITEWISLFKENHNWKKGIPAYLIGNKSDLEKKVEKDAIDKLVNETGYEFKEVSARNDDDKKLGKLFEEIAEKLYEDYVKSGRGNKSQNTIKIAHNKAPKKKGCCIFGPDIVQPNEKFD